MNESSTKPSKEADELIIIRCEWKHGGRFIPSCIHWYNKCYCTSCKKKKWRSRWANGLSFAVKAWRQIDSFFESMEADSIPSSIHWYNKCYCTSLYKKRNGERILRNKIIQKSLTSRCMLCIGYLMTTTCAASKTFIISLFTYKTFRFL